jgi:deoxyribose-phosphate aldolase
MPVPASPARSDQLEGWPDLVAPTRAELGQAIRAMEGAGLAALAVDPAEVTLARDLLGPSPIAVVALVAAPLGAMTSASRMAQAERALADGADELAVAIDPSLVRSGRLHRALEEFAPLRQLAGGRILRVICHLALLGSDLGADAAAGALDAGADVLMTNSPFDGEVSVEQVAAVRLRVGREAVVVASGGVTAPALAGPLLRAGATRVAVGWSAFAPGLVP